MKLFDEKINLKKDKTANRSIAFKDKTAMSKEAIDNVIEFARNNAITMIKFEEGRPFYLGALIQ